MPPKSRISRQMILDASYELVRESGIHRLNVRSVAARLKCSTQPIMYHFSTMEDLKTEVYSIVSTQHCAYIMNIDIENDPNPYLTISRRYIQFALDTPHLFRFLFQTERVRTKSLSDMVGSPLFAPVFDVMAKMFDLTQEQARDVFSSTFIGVHGYACLLANSSMDYDEKHSEDLIHCIFLGSLNYVKERRI